MFNEHSEIYYFRTIHVNYVTSELPQRTDFSSHPTVGPPTNEAENRIIPGFALMKFDCRVYAGRYEKV